MTLSIMKLSINHTQHVDANNNDPIRFVSISSHNIMTLNKMTLGKMTFYRMALSKMTFRIFT
jgi:hypothetical protein